MSGVYREAAASRSSPAVRAGGGRWDLHRPPASLRSLISFFIGSNFKFAFLRGSPPPHRDARAVSVWKRRKWRSGQMIFIKCFITPVGAVFLPPPLSLFSAFLWHLIVRKCAWWMGIVVKAPQKGNKYSTGRMGISFFTVAGTSGVALPHQL